MFAFEVQSTQTDANDRVTAAILRNPETSVRLGLITHAANPGEPVSEFRTGLDHLEFGVADLTELDGWAQRLDDLGIPHSGVKSAGPNRILTFRDPDNIQLEFFVDGRSYER